MASDGEKPLTTDQLAMFAASSSVPFSLDFPHADKIFTAQSPSDEDLIEIFPPFAPVYRDTTSQTKSMEERREEGDGRDGEHAGLEEQSYAALSDLPDEILVHILLYVNPVLNITDMERVTYPFFELDPSIEIILQWPREALWIGLSCKRTVPRSELRRALLVLSLYCVQEHRYPQCATSGHGESKSG